MEKENKKESKDKDNEKKSMDEAEEDDDLIDLLNDNTQPIKESKKIKIKDKNNNNNQSKKPSYKELQALIDPITKKKWEDEQLSITKMIKDYDDLDFDLSKNSLKPLKYIAGMDLSFSKTNQKKYVSYITVLSFPELKSVYEDFEIGETDVPYVPGFLAFREAPALKRLIDKMIANKIKYIPQVILFDGNGLLHPRSCGIACHVGVQVNIPSIGVSKNVFAIDGINKDYVNDLCNDAFSKGENVVKLVGFSKKVWGAAVRSTKDCWDPVIVSLGHRISLDTAIEVVLKSCLYRVPEPIRVSEKL